MEAKWGGNGEGEVMVKGGKMGRKWGRGSAGEGREMGRKWGRERKRNGEGREDGKEMGKRR